MRAFIAVEIPDDVKDEIDRLIAHFKAGGHPVRWVNRRNQHLTLVFLGENSPEFMAGARESLMRAVIGLPAFTLSLNGLGVFPNEHSARVIWLGLEQGVQELTNLVLRIQKELSGLGFLPDRRSFSAHLTIGRARERITDITPILSRSFVSRSFPVSRVVLFRSILQPTGPVHEELAVAALAG